MSIDAVAVFSFSGIVLTRDDVDVCVAAIDETGVDLAGTFVEDDQFFAYLRGETGRAAETAAKRARLAFYRTMVERYEILERMPMLTSLITSAGNAERASFRDMQNERI